MNTPQIIASVIVLSLHWNDNPVCDLSHTLKWKWWAIISCLRMLAFNTVVLFIHVFKPWLEEHQTYLAKAVRTRNTIDAIGLVWFVVGNMWLLGEDNDGVCNHPEESPLYNLCISILVINYVQICLPCILAILLIPVFCFCMPCLIRILARLQNPIAHVVRLCLSHHCVGMLFLTES